jgi:hypothetical protein
MAMKKQTAEAIDHVARLRAVLGAMGVKRGTFVDDQFSPKFDDAWARSRAVEEEKRKELISAWGDGRWEEDSADEDRPNVESRWRRLNHAAQVSLLAKITSLIRETTAAEDPKDVSFFSDYWPSDTCPLEELGPEDFDQAYIRTAILDAGPSVLFVDLVLGEDMQEGGVELLKEVFKQDSDRKTVCVVLTRQPGSESPDYWGRLAEKYGLDPGAAVAISKGSMENVASFESELRRALLNAMSPGLMDWAWGIAKEALAKAISDTKIEGDVLNAVVLQSSQKEGIQPTDTLFRLIDEEYRRERDSLALAPTSRKGFAVFKTKLEALAKISSKDDGDPPLSLRVQRLMQRHLYRRQVDTPEWASPIWLGDLWEATLIRSTTEGAEEWNEHYVLIAQPCDIILRSKDGARSQEWAILIPIKENGTEQETMVRLKYFGESKCDAYWAHLRKARVANVNVLDMVALAGPAVKMAELSSLRQRSHVQPSVEKRTLYLADWLERTVASAAPSLALALFPGPGPVAKLTISQDTIDFHFRRVGRIEPELSRLLLQRYGNFVSRHALPHDFAEYSGD